MKLSGKVVFASGAAGDVDIWTLNLNNGAMFQLTHGNYMNDAPKWSPDGRYLIYCSSKSGPGTSRIRVMQVDSQRIAELNYDRSALEAEIGAVVKDYGLFTMLTPDFIQRQFIDSAYFGSERYPHWKA